LPNGRDHPAGCFRANIARSSNCFNLEFWKFTGELRDGGCVDRPFDWINEEGLLSVADVRAIVRELNQKSETTPAYAGAEEA